MKLGFISSILDTSSFEEVIDTAAALGYECVEVACWPKEKAARRYAGITHIDIEALTDEKIASIHETCLKKNVAISALAYYPNTLTDDLPQRQKAVDHLKAMIEAAPKLHVDTVTTFIGRVQNLTVEENLEIFKEVWTPIIRFAEEHKVKNRHRKLSHALRAGPVARRPEPDDDSRHLAQGIPDDPQRFLRPELRSLSFCMAADRLHQTFV